MKTKLIPLMGDMKENLYQLGLKEQEGFRRIEERVTRLLSTSEILRQGKDILSRAKASVKKRQPQGPFEECVQSYAEGLGISFDRYMSFLSLFEVAAHYGQAYPELKSLLPGCASVFHKTNGDIHHTRLFDFPLIGLFDEMPRLYYWKTDGRPSVLTYSCEGLAPLFFQGVHECGLSFALHHKPGTSVHEGESVFRILFDSIMETKAPSDLKKEIKKHSTVTKWCYLFTDTQGQVQVIDQDGLGLISETFTISETPLIFTNIPLQNNVKGFESFISLCQERQMWIKDKLAKDKKCSVLDSLVDVTAQADKKWIHPGATLSTVGAYEVNLTKGHVDIKEGPGVIVKSDMTIRLSLDSSQSIKTLKEKDSPTKLEEAWKMAGQAQSDFDQGYFAEAYHHLQMAEASMPHKTWKSIFTFYLALWDFRFVSSQNDLAHVYKKVKHLSVPPQILPQWTLFMMRLEKRLDLAFSVSSKDISESYREVFEQEIEAPKALFSTWMKLLYPRLEILEVFSPHDQK